MMNEKKLKFLSKKAEGSKAMKDQQKEQTEKKENMEAVSLCDSDFRKVTGGTDSAGEGSSDQWGGGLLDEGDVDIT